MPQERGNPKRGPTYYNFVARHRRLEPSAEPISPPISNVHLVGPSLNNSPCSIQNSLDDDKPMAYVEEEFPHAPPQAPTNSSLFSTSDILTSPHTYGKHSLESDCALETKSCYVEEEIPTTEQEEEAPPVGESQPTAASIPKTLSMWCLGAFATYL